jgi:Bacteriocin-protection, YdeI or OmpD-Associated/Domain of unknown function (DUF1905)
LGWDSFGDAGDRHHDQPHPEFAVPTPSPQTHTITFETTLSAFGNNTGIMVPEHVIAELDAGQRPAVIVTINGYEYPNTIGVMSGKHLVSVSAAIRKVTGLAGGDPVHVTLTVADGPRTVDVPADFQTALTANSEASRFFTSLSNSLQRYHVDNINAARAADTRQRRIAKAIELFLAGKQR